jgi:hypothetical protein
VDIEGAEYVMLQGALATLQQTPRPIWMVEIVSTEHQPAGVSVNPQLVSTFECFFEHGYLAVTADSRQIPIDLQNVQSVASLQSVFSTHNFIFR